jgi:ornithine--oxo-acid transaminase
MSFDLGALIAERRSEKFRLFEQHLNPQALRVLRVLGFDIDYVGAEGAYLFDAGGQRYLDLLSGFGVFALGRNHPTVIRALEQVLRGQLAGLVQLDVSLLAGLLAEQLLARMPWLGKAFFCNSGAEAVEAAIKLSRAATGRSRIVHCEHAFHGLTYGALSLCGDRPFRERFGPFVGDCAAIRFDDLAALEQALSRKEVAAFIVEPVQGKGVHLPSDEYLPAAARLCRRYGTLLVADEVQCGIGRTGRFLACEHWGAEPDMVLLAKALSGGFVPVGAVAMRGWIFDRVFDRMDRAFVHGSTFAKIDLAMAAGLATLAAMDEERLIERAADLGERLIKGLRGRLGGTEFVREVRGRGMMIGIELGPPRNLRLKAAYALLEQANEGLFCQLLLMPLLARHHILAQVAGHAVPVIKLLPPFVVGEDDLLWIESSFHEVLHEAESLGGIWELGRTLAGHSLRARIGAPEP